MLTLSYTISDSGNPGPATSAARDDHADDPGRTVWFVDNTNGLDTNKGTMGSPFKTLTKVSTVDAAGDGIFLYSGTYAAGITLKATEKLVGQGTTGTTFDAIFGLTPPGGHARAADRLLPARHRPGHGDARPAAISCAGWRSRPVRATVWSAPAA